MIKENLKGQLMEKPPNFCKTSEEKSENFCSIFDRKNLLVYQKALGRKTEKRRIEKKSGEKGCRQSKNPQRPRLK